MENRLKEAQIDLFADRLSAQAFRVNQLRLWLATCALTTFSPRTAVPLALDHPNSPRHSHHL
jgi:hypothetical protein